MASSQPFKQTVLSFQVIPKLYHQNASSDVKSHHRNGSCNPIPVLMDGRTAQVTVSLFLGIVQAAHKCHVLCLLTQEDPIRRTRCHK
ncbi:hypothetical protein TNIN_398271 [Trichonephila inaurata madagascariensis]|uniref:Uncharacterized protein n=1 Tax=Trichonephila inaurata madagascariensis TaxID=2747483 RepID=A0A8X6WN81_9ARAC|nr:hypothetical protein TNIN_398271 [Trichonephila inaurata madagascariensis]